MRVLILAAAFAACPVVSAQEKAAQPAATPEAGLPAGSALYGKHVDAIGGLDNLKAIKTLVTKARFTTSNAAAAPGRLEVYKEAPGRMYKLLDVIGMVTLETWCDGTSVWVRNSNTGASKLSGDAAAEVAQEASIVGELDYTSHFRELKTLGKESFADRECYAVQATGNDGKMRTIYFDAQTGLIQGARIPIPGGDKVLTLTMSDYQEFGGVKRPMKVVEDDGTNQTTVTYHTVEVNRPLKVSLEAPADVKDATK
jgi:hypothetical protein